MAGPGSIGGSMGGGTGRVHNTGGGGGKTVERAKSLRTEAEKVNKEFRSINKEIEKFVKGLEKAKKTTANLPGGAGAKKGSGTGKVGTHKGLVSDLVKINKEIQMLKSRGDHLKGVAQAQRLVNLEMKRYEVLQKHGVSLDTKFAKRLQMTKRRYDGLATTLRQLNKQGAGIGVYAPGKGPGGSKDKGVMAGGAMGWGGSMVQQVRYWGQLRLLYGMYGKITQGMKTFVDMTGTVNRAVRTSISDVTDQNAVWRAQNEIADAATKYLSRHIGTIGEYTEAVHQLTQAEMERSEAIRIAPTIMALSKGLDADIKQTSRVMVGLNELFDSMGGVSSDSGRIDRMASMLSTAVKKQVTTIEDLRTSLAYVAPIAKSAGMEFSELIATVSLLHTNMLQSARAGTAMRQMLNALAKNADKLNAAFNLGIDPNEPLHFTKVMEQLGVRLKEGQMTAGKLKDFMEGFGLRGAPGAIIIPEQFESYSKMVRELEKSKMSDLFGMRDIMEKNVPGQLKIMSQNFDLLIGSILRGAFGGKEFALTLEKINVALGKTIPMATAVGKTIKALAGGWKLVAIVAAFSIQKMIKMIMALHAAQKKATWGKALGSAATGNLVGVGLHAAMLTTFGIMAVRERARSRREEQYRQAMDNLSTVRTEIETIERKIASLKDLERLELDELERKRMLADVNKDLLGMSSELSDARIDEISDVGELTKKYEALLKNKKRLEQTEAERANKQIVEKTLEWKGDWTEGPDSLRTKPIEWIYKNELVEDPEAQASFEKGQADFSYLKEALPKFIKNALKSMSQEDAIIAAEKVIADTKLELLFTNLATYSKNRHKNVGPKKKKEFEYMNSQAISMLRALGTMTQEYGLNSDAAARKTEMLRDAFKRLLIQIRAVRGEYEHLSKPTYDERLSFVKALGMKGREGAEARVGLLRGRYAERTRELAGLLDNMGISQKKIAEYQEKYADATKDGENMTAEQQKSVRSLEQELGEMLKQKEDMLKTTVEITKELRRMRIELQASITELKKLAGQKAAWGLIGSGMKEYYAGKKYKDAGGNEHTMNRRQYIAHLARESHKKLAVTRMSGEIQKMGYAGTGGLEQMAMGAAGKDTEKASRWLQALRFGVDPFYDKMKQRHAGDPNGPEALKMQREKMALKEIVANHGRYNTESFMNNGFVGLMQQKYGSGVGAAMPAVLDKLAGKLDPFDAAVNKFSTASGELKLAADTLKRFAGLSAGVGLENAVSPGPVPSVGKDGVNNGAEKGSLIHLTLHLGGDQWERLMLNSLGQQEVTTKILESAMPKVQKALDAVKRSNDGLKQYTGMV